MAFADRFVVRNSLYVTTAIAACVATYMVVFWESMPVTQRIIGLYYILIAAHEWEELKYPGGFVELAISLTGMPMRDMCIPKFALFCITVYLLLIPFCLPQFHWLVIGALVLGIIEPLAHIVAGRANPKTRIYSPGMVTSLLFMLPLDAFTIWYVVAVEPFAWYWWLAGAALLLIPLFGTQRLIVVKMMGMSYGEFVRNALDSILGRRKLGD